MLLLTKLFVLLPSLTSMDSDLRDLYFYMERSRYEWITKEWVATKRAQKAEREIARLKEELEHLKNNPELLFPS